MNAKNSTKRYVICVRNDDYEVDLALGKVYRVIPDRVGQARGFVRIVDESGEDYLYPNSFFLPIPVSKTIQKALAKAS